MKKLLIQILIFVVVISIVYSIPCIVFEKKAKECTAKTPYAEINEVINMKNADADLIVLGNSRAARSYNDSLMTSLSGVKCMNLGMNDFPFDYSYHIMYENYIRQNKEPKYIIVDVNPWTFARHSAHDYTIHMLPYIDRPEFQFYIDKCPQLSKVDKLLFFRYFGKLSKVLKEIDDLNHPENKEGETEWYNDYFLRPTRMECSKPVAELFVRFLDDCKQKNICVIMISSPYQVNDGLSYLDMDDFGDIVKWYNSGKNFPIISYQDFFDSDTVFFSDPIHLSEYGKQVFTTKLMHDLDSFGIIKQHNNTIDSIDQ